MKKFLSIKNSQGIYVARASFSSDETVIDFVNSKSTDNCNIKPISIAVTPDQLRATTASAVAASASSSELTAFESFVDDTISVPSQSLIVAKSNSKKNKRLNKVLTLLHLKKKTTTISTSTKMSDILNDDATKKTSIDEMPSTSSSFPQLPTPKAVRSKGRTAALVKKFSLTPKKSPPKELSVKKSAIPLRTATSVETISNTPQLALRNRVETTTNVSHHSVSEMNLVNIDYRQESTGDNLDIGVKVGQTQYRTIRSSIASGSIDGGGGSGGGAARNLSIKSGISSANDGNSNNNNNSKLGTGRKSTSSEKLQITISGKKRTNTIDSAFELQQRKQQSLLSNTNEIEPSRIERKAMQQSPKKFNINHDLTLMNTVGVPPAPKTQAPSAIPLYRAVAVTAAPTTATTTMTASIKNVGQRGTTIKAQSTMQSQQSVDTSASVGNVQSEKIAAYGKTDFLTITSFDVDEPDDIAAATKLPIHDKDTSLFTEIIEAERRNSMSMDLPERERRYPGVAASETIKFGHQSTSSSDTNGGGQETSKSPPSPPSSSPPHQHEIVPKVIIEEVATLKSDKTFEPTLSADIGEDASNIDGKDKELLMYTLTQSSGAKVLQPNEENDTTQPTLQFEVGKKVRPIFPSNQNLHHNTYSALVIDPATVLTTSSYLDTHNSSDSFAHVHGGTEPLSAPNFDAQNDKELDGVKNQSTLHQKLTNSFRGGRRRIAYIAQVSNKSASGSPSTSDSTINTEDDDILPENQPDSLLTSQFDDDLHTSSTFITDFLMPPYGDLVWDDDGVIERIPNNCQFFFKSILFLFFCRFCSFALLYFVLCPSFFFCIGFSFNFLFTSWNQKKNQQMINSKRNREKK